MKQFKIFIQILSVLFILTSALSFSSCSINDITGTWESKHGTEISFYDEGACSEFKVYDYTYAQSYKIASDGTLILKVDSRIGASVNQVTYKKTDDEETALNDDDYYYISENKLIFEQKEFIRKQ